MTLGPFLDATGESLILAAPPSRIVSLVPSVTELLFALGAGDAVAGCTIYCREPAERVATITRVGGEKNPKLERIRELGADLVIANVEENLREHVVTLRGWSIPVYVIYPHTVAEGIRLVRDLGAVVGHVAEGLRMEASLLDALHDARRRFGGRSASRVFYPIWRNPWMTIGRDTYAHDMLTVCGGINVFAGATARYPEVTLAQVAQAAPEVVLLPDEPYRFRQAHLADFEACPDLPARRDGRIHLVDGKLATWYGPRIAEALRELPRLLAGV